LSFYAAEQAQNTISVRKRGRSQREESKEEGEDGKEEDATGTGGGSTHDAVVSRGLPPPSITHTYPHSKSRVTFRIAHLF